MQTKIRQIIRRNGHTATIVASFEDENAVQFATSITTGLVSTTKVDASVCRMAQVRTVPPASEAPKVVRTKGAGTYMIKATSTENDENRVSIAKGVVEVSLH